MAIFYPWIIAKTNKLLDTLFGCGKTICIYNSYQFNDYSKYDVAEHIEPFSAKDIGEKNLRDLQNAYELGQHLVWEAKELHLE